MRRHRPLHLYVATDGDLFKIGISGRPERRMFEHGDDVNLVGQWRRPYAREIEAVIKDTFSDRLASRGTEWFRTTEPEVMFHVLRALRILDNHESVKAGRPPVPRGVREKAAPPFELAWLK